MGINPIAYLRVMWHDPKDDPYSYDASGRTVVRVEILLDRIPPKTLAAVQYCMSNNTPFILKSESECVGFWPVDMSYISPLGNFTCSTMNQYLNVIKLTLVSCPEIHIPPRKIEAGKKQDLLD